MHVTLTPNLELASVETLDADALLNPTANNFSRKNKKNSSSVKDEWTADGRKSGFSLRSLSWYYIRAQDATIGNLKRDIAMEIKQSVTAHDGMRDVKPDAHIASGQDGAVFN